MGVFDGSINYTKFYVRGSVPKRFAEPFMKAIELRRFEALDPDAEDEERSGWCVAGNPLDLDLRQEQVIYNSVVVLGMRTDRWRVPRPLFQAHFREAERAALQRSGKEKLSKRDKDELKFRIHRKLRKRVFPSMRAFDVCWDLERQLVLFWNRSARVNETFSALFEATFKLQLDEESPFMAARRLLEAEGRQSQLLERELEASSFATFTPSLQAADETS